MGSTVVALRVEGHGYEVAWVGDSRAYYWDGRRLRQLTRDHSFVQGLLDRGSISEQEARAHPDRHVISQSLGYANLREVTVDTVRGTFYRDGRILLCSDGLTSELSDGEIATILKGAPDPKGCVRQLVDSALEHGGYDNIKVSGADQFIASPVIGDVNGDALVEVVTAAQNGQIATYSLNRRVSPGSLLWPEFLGSGAQGGH